jgi:hypothetical protein
VVERLFLDRIDLQSGDVAAGDAQLAASIESNATDPGAAGPHQAAVPARQTSQAVGFRPNKIAMRGDRVVGENGGE